VVQTGLIGESKEGNLARLREMGIEDANRVYNADELASGTRYCLQLAALPWNPNGRSSVL